MANIVRCLQNCEFFAIKTMSISINRKYWDTQPQTRILFSLLSTHRRTSNTKKYHFWVDFVTSAQFTTTKKLENSNLPSFDLYMTYLKLIIITQSIRFAELADWCRQSNIIEMWMIQPKQIFWLICDLFGNAEHFQRIPMSLSNLWTFSMYSKRIIIFSWATIICIGGALVYKWWQF